MCDTMAATASATSGGEVLFGKNSDREFTESQYLEFVPAARHEPGARVRLTHVEIDQAPQTYAVLLSKPHWIWGAEMGANEHGLVIGNEGLWTKLAPSAAKSIIGMDHLRLGLERARDVDEAIHVMTTNLRRYGQGGTCSFRRDFAYHNSFILADPRGAKVLETVGLEWVVKPVAGYFAISNAMTIEADFEASSPTLKSWAAESGIYEEGAPFSFKAVYEDGSMTLSGRQRHARAMALLGEKSGRLQPADFFRILRDHKEGIPLPGRPPPRICAHCRENPLGQTTGSWVASLTADRRIHWVTGTAAPCTGLFKPVLLETGLPEHGPRPGPDEEDMSLWWRHEQLRRYLDACDASIREAFLAERDSLEARFVQQMSACPSPADAKGREQARSLVQHCWRAALEFEDRWFERTRAQPAELQAAL